MAGTASAATRPSARDRLLAAADELFYAEGVQTVGIDRIIEHAGVAKASLYKTFGSKDELVRAYLEGRQAGRRERVLGAVEAAGPPREKLLAVFDALATAVRTPGYNGCAFINATTEAKPGSGAVETTDHYRAWLRELLVGLARDAGAGDPQTLALHLHLLYDGTAIAARMHHDADPAGAARAAAEILVAAALAGPSRA